MKGCKNIYKYLLKRFFDFIIAIVGIIILSPVIVIAFLILCFTNNGQPFFLQPRPGKNEKIFKIIKFKSMRDETNENGKLLTYQERVTNIGKFIRKYSLDEIPQLFNVLKGDMSIIGPRPLLVKYLPLYDDKQRMRHKVKPGITGWAQVNGRNAISWQEKFELDTWYTKNISFKTDLKIILLTIKKVVLKEGVDNNENVNMPPFLGNN